MMNETMRKPTTGTRCPTLFDMWHRIFYMPSHTDTAGDTQDYPVTYHWGEKVIWAWWVTPSYNIRI